MSEISSKQNNIYKQLEEIELISSIYSNTNEFVIEDPEAIEECRSFLTTKKLPKRNIGYIIKFNLDVTENNIESHTQLDTEEKEVNYFQVRVFLNAFIFLKSQIIFN
jgi:hypothetical protein